MARLPTFFALLLFIGSALSAGTGCPSGLSGPDCMTCGDDKACQAALNAPDAKCVNDLAVSENAEVKAYSCVLPSSSPIAAFIVPDSPSITCITGLGNSSEPASCEISIKLNPSVASASILCEATDCKLVVGKSGLSCNKTKCSCPGSTNCGSTTVNSLVTGVSGVASLACDNAGACNIALNLPISPIKATCTSKECSVSEG